MKRKPYFQDPYRPLFHYTAQSHVINDPNGLLYYDGEYHLMHQYNIHNHIHWGHAVSRDLIHWEHLPPALEPDTIGQIWSGSAVIDWNNTSGLQTGKEPVFVALFTYNEHVDSQQSQGLAYSNDRGRTWRKYWGNPVLTSGGKKDFRDPKVFWLESGACWVMVLACFDHVEFYQSENLLTWRYSGEFGGGEGSPAGVWECPDLFCLPVAEKPDESRWVLVVSVNDGAPAGGTGMQYFIGRFDGSRFENENSPETALWLDYGQDFYAGVTWNGIPGADGRRLMIAWADNWRYRDALPTQLFKGQFSMVRELSLRQTPEGVRLCQRPVRELSALEDQREKMEPCRLSAGQCRKTALYAGALSFRCRLRPEDRKGRAELRFVYSGGEWLSIGYDFAGERLYVDRTHAGINGFPGVTGIHTAPMKLEKGDLELQVLADTSQIEVFGGRGAVVLTDLVFPSSPDCWVELHSEDADLLLLEGEAASLRTAWPEKRACLPQFTQLLDGSWADVLEGLEGDCGGLGGIFTEKIVEDFSFSVNVTLKAYRERQCAGVWFGGDGQGGGFRVMLDWNQKQISVYQREHRLKAQRFSLNLNRKYRLSLAVREKRLTVFLDEVELFVISLEDYRGGLLGLCVENTAAVFRRPLFERPKQGKETGRRP